MCPESELLLCCARSSVDDERSKRIRSLLRDGIDWTHLLRQANKHGLMPLLCLHLTSNCLDAMPRPIVDQLRDHFHSNARSNLLLTEELLELLDLLAAHGIRAIPFKGPALAASVYGNIALRQFCDLDLLVRENEVPKTKDLMISLGYEPQINLARAREGAFLRYQCEILFQRDKVVVEIQWRIAPRYFSFPLDYERLWERLRPVALGEREVFSLSPEDSLLILCVHGAKHVWERLGWICDVAELIRVHKGMNWRRVIEQAGESGSERMLFLGLFLASDLLGATLPAEVSQTVLAEPPVKALGAQVRERLFAETDGVQGFIRSSLFQLGARERLRDRFRYCFRLALTTTLEDWEFLSLPSSLSFLYYPLRPIRLARKYGLGLVKRASDPFREIRAIRGKLFGASDPWRER